MVSCEMKHLRAQRSVTFNRGLLPYPTQTKISLDSLNFVTILCIEDDERHKCFTMRNVIFKLFDNSLKIYGTK